MSNKLPTKYVMVKVPASEDLTASTASLEADPSRVTNAVTLPTGDSKLATESKAPSKGKAHLSAVRVTTKNPGKVPKGELLMLFRYVASIDTTGGGLISQAFPWDVSATADFSSAAALFSECKVHEAVIHLQSQLPTAGVNARGVCGVDYSVSNSAPGSESAVLQLERAKMHCVAKATQTTIRANAGVMAWATTASPTPGPYAGLYGQFSIGGSGTNSIGVANALVEITVRFRGRK
jgi:hypothetical protein